jgi:hypothetical protein
MGADMRLPFGLLLIGFAVRFLAFGLGEIPAVFLGAFVSGGPGLFQSDGYGLAPALDLSTLPAATAP